MLCSSKTAHLKANKVVTTHIAKVPIHVERATWALSTGKKQASRSQSYDTPFSDRINPPDAGLKRSVVC